MNQQMKVFKEITRVADGDAFHERAEKFGNIAAEAFGSRHRNQMTNLENIANSTLKVTDVLDYIKKQVARSEKNKMWRKDDFGTQLKKYIEESLRKRRKEVCKILGNIEEGTVEGQRIHLNLIRQFVGQLVVHYEYRVAIGDEMDDNNS